MMNSVTLTRGAMATIVSAVAVGSTIVALAVGESPTWVTLLAVSFALVGLTCVLAVKIIVGAAVQECLDGFALTLEMHKRTPNATVHPIAQQREPSSSSRPAP